MEKHWHEHGQMDVWDRTELQNELAQCGQLTWKKSLPFSYGSALGNHFSTCYCYKFHFFKKNVSIACINEIVKFCTYEFGLFHL